MERPEQERTFGLDGLHDLRISIRGHDGKWPVSPIKFAQTAETAKAERLSRTGFALGRRFRHQRSRARPICIRSTTAAREQRV